MNFFESVIYRLFPPKVPVVVKDSIKRSTSFRMGYEAWLSDPNSIEFIRDTLRQIKLELAGLGTSLNASVFNNRGTEGVFFAGNPNNSYRNLEYLFEWITTSIRSQGYVYQYNGRIYEEIQDSTKETYKRYLKPKIQFDDNGISNHRFGNITVEYMIENGNSFFFKILSSVYSDSRYSNDGGLSELIDLIQTDFL